ncbi:MAG: hypothetical protein DSY55_01180 [Clostridia bacterium]|nr:MAG: hypothetical protein DSY55_01180 [Clostridia bacterium]
MSKEQKNQSPNPYVQELNDLGKKFGQLIKATLESPQLQEVRKEVADGFQSAIEDINEVMVKARESDVTKDVVQKAARTVEDMKAAPATESIKGGLMNALHTVNKELEELLQRMNQSKQKSDAPPQSQEETPAGSPDNS